MKRFVLIALFLLVLGSCASEPSPQPTLVPTDTLWPTNTPRPTHTSLPTITPLPTSTPTPELSESDREVLATAWRACIAGQASAEVAIEQFNSDSPPKGFALLALILLPSTSRNYLRDEAEFPPQFEGLRDRIVSELDAIVSAIDGVTDYGTASEELETRRDNLKEIELEIEKMVPMQALKPEPTDTPSVARLGDRSKPVPAAQPFLFEHHGAQCAIALEETMRGEAAREFRNRNERYLTYSPQEGNEFYMARFRLAYLEGSEDQATGFDDGDFSIEADNKMYGHTISIWENALSVSMYPGGEETGWVVFQVPSGANVQHIKFSPFLADYAVWFAVP